MEENTKKGPRESNRADSELFVDVIGVLSHSVRTTLNALVGYTEIILDGKLGDINPMQEHALKEVLKSSMETLETVNQILDASNVEALKVEVLTGSVPLRQALARFERDIILKVLQKTHFNVSKAASILGTTRRILHYRMEKLKIMDERPAAIKSAEDKAG